MADVLGIPLAYAMNVAPNMGTAYIGYMAAGIKKRWEDVSEWKGKQQIVEPIPSYREMYDGFFSIYLNLYEKHKTDFKLLADRFD